VSVALCAKLSEALLAGWKSLLFKVKTKQNISSVANMLAKSLNGVDRPIKIVTGKRLVVSMDGGTACSKRTQRMITSRKETRNLPRANRPRNQARDVEGETATCVEASISLTVKVRSMGFHRGMLLWRVSREAFTNLGDPYSSGNGTHTQPTEEAGMWMRESDL
jgi:hypothetical protein